MSNNKLEVRNLQFSYPDGHEAVKNISFQVQQGEAVGIIGANGAGKSTIIMLVMGILSPEYGEVLVEDVSVNKKTLSMIRQKIGLVTQDPDDQLFMTTVFDDIAFGPRNYKLDEKEVESRVEKALDLVGISHLRDRAPFKLSGGEKRSVAIASVLSMNPEILIMDEPTSALDPKSRRRLIGLLNSFEHTMIITSHDLDMVLETCKRIIVIKEGRIAAEGASDEILSNEGLLDECGLEIPLSLQNCPVCGTSKNSQKNKYKDFKSKK